MLTPAQTHIISQTVPVLEEHGNHVTEVFYQNLLTDHPSLNEVFNQANQANGQQANALAASVYAYAKNIDNLEPLIPAVKHISNKHASLGVKPEQYALVGEYLLAAFGQVLGDAFTTEIKDAWTAAYNQLADVMIATENQLYSQEPAWTDWRDFHVTAKDPESSEITSFVMSPVDKHPLPSYLPGQYISVKVQLSIFPHSQTRQYSLSDKYNPDHYRISVKREKGVPDKTSEALSHPGFVSNALHDNTSVGDVIKISRPYGEFFFDPSIDVNAPIVLLSAGVGLTPLLSILNTSLEKSPNRPISWIQGARDTQTRAFADHINQMSKIGSNMKKTIFLSKPSTSDTQSVDYDQAGRVNLSKCDRIQDLFLDEPSTRYYICGPSSFMSDIQKKLLEYGVDASRIKTENFGTGALEGL